MLIGAAVFSIAFFGTYLQYIRLPNVTLEWKSKIDDSLYTPDYTQESGPELALVYIGSSTCTASNAEFLPRTIEKLKLIIKKRAKKHGRSFSAVGIAVDWEVENGIEYLHKFGRFDEIMTGQKWSNIGALKYMWEDIPGKGGTPQVLVVDHVLQVPKGQGDVLQYSISNEELIIRKVGTKEIRQWVERGAPVPMLSSTAEAQK